MKCHKCQIEMPDDAVTYTPFRNYGGVCESCAPSAWGLCHRLWERHYGDPAPCSYCGRPVANPKYGSRKWDALRFCTSTRSTRYYRKPKPLSSISCRQCGKSFQAKRNDAKYCSTQCRVAMHRAARHNQEAAA